MGKLNGSGFWAKISLKNKIQGEEPNKKKRLYFYTGKCVENQQQALAALRTAIDRYPFGDINCRNFSNGHEANLDERQFLLRVGNEFKVLRAEECIISSLLQEQTASSDKDQTGIDSKLREILPRLASVDTLRKNKELTEAKFINLTTNGGKLQLARINPFKPSLYNGQIIWESNDPVSASDVSEVIRMTSRYGRSLHVNTGTHGSKNGSTVSQHKEFAEAKFSKQDLDAAWDLNNVSVHIMSQAAPALSPKNVDIINAWCYSEKSKHKSDVRDDNITKVIKSIFESLTSKEEAKAAQSSNRPGIP